VKGTAPLASFAVNATNIYFVNRDDGTLSRVPRSGGAATVLATGQYYAGEMVLDTNALYWLDNGNVSETGGVNTMPLSGGNYTALVTSEPNPLIIALDATNVYWSDYSPHYVKKVPKAGGAVVVLVSEDDADGAYNLVTDTNNLYWTSLVNGGTIFALPLNGGAMVSVATGITGVDNAWSVGATGGYVYFKDESASPALSKVKSSGGTATVIANSASLSDIIVDDAVYMSGQPSNAIVRISFDGATMTTLALDPGSAFIYQIAVQGNDVFWLTSDGAIKSTAKSP
jgi:hypothetical protein